MSGGVQFYTLTSLWIMASVLSSIESTEHIPPAYLTGYCVLRCTSFNITQYLPLLSNPPASVTAGIDALGEVTVQVQDEASRRVFIGKSADTDVIHASAEAYLHAVNRLTSNRGAPDKAHPQKDVV